MGRHGNRGGGERPRRVERPDQRVRRERAQRQVGRGPRALAGVARAGAVPPGPVRAGRQPGGQQGRVGDVALGRPHGRHEAELMAGRRRDGQRDRAARAHPARHLDDGRGWQGGDGRPVGHVEDQPRGRAAGQGRRQGNGNRLVAAGRHVGLVPLARRLARPQLGEVAPVALVVGLLPQPGGRGGAGGGRPRSPAGPVAGGQRRRRGGVEPPLPLADMLPAGPPGREHVPQRLSLGVVPVQVLIRERAQRPRQVRPEQPPLLGQPQPPGVGQQAGQQVGPALPPQAVQAQRPEPAQVVDPDVVRVDPVGHRPEGGARVDATGGAGPADQPDRRVADPDHPRAEGGRHHLGDDPGRVGHRDQPRAGGHRGRPAGDCGGHRDGPGGARQAARADRLLAQQAALEGRPLVADPAVEAARAQRREDHVGPGQGLVETRDGGDQAAQGRPGQRVAAQHARHHVQPPGVGVVQRQPGDRQPAARQGPGDERHPEAAAAENSDTHAPDPTARPRPAVAQPIPRPTPRSPVKERDG